MATFTAIKNKKQTAGVLGDVLKYVQQEKKTCFFITHDVEEAVQAVGVAEAYLRNVPERNTILTLGHDRDSADMSLV